MWGRNLVSTDRLSRYATCRGWWLAPQKSTKTSTANEAEDESVNALLAQADYIVQNPDEFLVEAEVEATADIEVDEVVLA